MADFLIPPVPESWFIRAFRWLKLPSTIWAAIILGSFGFAGVVVASKMEAAKLRDTIEQLRSAIQQQAEAIRDKDARIQVLATELVPFRTLAIDKFGSAEQEQLQKYAVYITGLQSNYLSQVKQLDELRRESEEAKKKYGEPELTYLDGQQCRPETGWLAALIVYEISNTIPLQGGFNFHAEVIQGDAKIVEFRGSGAHGTDGSGKISPDGKTATTNISPLSGDRPILRIEVSNPCYVRISCKQLNEPTVIQISGPVSSPPPIPGV